MRHRHRHPWLGRILHAIGRQFLCTRVRHARSRRGLLFPTLTWVSTCAEPSCGRAFEQTTCRKPRAIDMQPFCRTHHGTEAERRQRRRTAAVLGGLVADLPDGTLVTMVGEVIERDPPLPDDDCSNREADHGR